jgi:hypothetical protein
MKRFLVMLLAPVLVFGALGISFITHAKTETKEEQIPFPEVPRVTKEELKELMGKPGVVVLDCRPQEQWTDSQQKLPGAVHEDPLKVQEWAHKYEKDAKIVIY